MPRLLLASMLFAASLTAFATPPVARDAWVRAAPPGAKVQAGYLTLANPGSAPLVLVGATSDAFGRVEVHDMTMEDGVMRMRRLDRLELAPGADLALAPGGRHLMLFEPARRLVPGDEVEITLEFAPPAAPLAVIFEVHAAGSRPADDDEHAHH